jgi:xanthine/CO dehydrogenase XdhC/CoxF family maturation factor
VNTPQEFAPLLAAIRRLEAAGFSGGAALATLTRTRGSTFRRPGARMLVCGNGTLVRGLSGGCPDADIALRAAGVIAADRPELVHYNGDNIFDPMIEAGCGGDIEVLIEPLSSRADVAFLDVVERCLNARRTGLLATVYARNGKCLSPRPRRMVWTDESSVGDIGDGRLATAIRERAVREGRCSPGSQTIETDEGAMDVLIEPLSPPHVLVLVGISAVSLALARFAVQLGWITTLVDHRSGCERPVAVPDAVRYVALPPDALVGSLAPDSRTSVVVMTHRLDTDIAYLLALRDEAVAYLGALGSRSRVATILGATGLGPEQLRAPAGLDVGSETPEEIALAIAAEILAATNARHGGVLSAVDGPIH